VERPFKPCNQKHSVEEASAVIFLSSSIENIPDFISLSKEDAFLRDSFQGRKTVYDLAQGVVSLRETDSLAEKDKKDSKMIGFVLASDDNDKNPCIVFQGINEDEKYFFSYHDKAYTRWANFKKGLVDTLQPFKDLLHPYNVNGIGITYIDRYEWEQASAIDYRLIFQPNNKYMPSIFFQEGNVDGEVTSTMHIRKNQYDFYVRLRIEPVFKDDKKFLSIIHNAVFVTPDVSLSTMLYKAPESFDDIIQSAHDLNKDLLKDLLLPDVVDMINML
jgi:uncharacterized protein (TIGR04255 family)